MFEAPQHQRDVGVVEVAVLDVESDVVITRRANSSGPMIVGPTTQPPQSRSLPARASCSRLGSFDDRDLDALGCRPAGELERGLHVVDAEGVGEVCGKQLGMRAGEPSALHSTRRRSSVTPDFRVRLLRSIVRMLIG